MSARRGTARASPTPAAGPRPGTRCRGPARSAGAPGTPSRTRPRAPRACAPRVAPRAPRDRDHRDAGDRRAARRGRRPAPARADLAADQAAERPRSPHDQLAGRHPGVVAGDLRSRPSVQLWPSRNGIASTSQTAADRRRRTRRASRSRRSRGVIAMTATSRITSGTIALALIDIAEAEADRRGELAPLEHVPRRPRPRSSATNASLWPPPTTCRTTIGFDGDEHRREHGAVGAAPAGPCATTIAIVPSTAAAAANWKAFVTHGHALHDRRERDREPREQRPVDRGRAAPPRPGQRRTSSSGGSRPGVAV